RTNHPTTISFKQLSSKQTNQAKPNYHHSLTKSRIQQPYTLQTNRTNNSKSRLLIRNIIRNMSHQVLRHTHKLSMRTIRSDSVTNLKTTNAFTNSNHLTHVTITQWDRLT